MQMTADRFHRHHITGVYCVYVTILLHSVHWNIVLAKMLRLNKIVTQVVNGSTTNTVALTESTRAQHIFFYFFPQQEKTTRPGSPHSDCTPDDFFKPLRDIKYTHQV